ncbi:MAG: hypothetical protein Q7V58_09560 [Actinomycetota bacterium]|nr:hypothetical protein [Actinomycetota bacterium]
MSNHYVTYTPDPGSDPEEPSGEFVFECVAPADADCRFECDCEEWVVTMRVDEAWHLDCTEECDEHSGGHLMRPVSCTVAPWFESDEVTDHLDPPRAGRHPVDCEWLSYGYAFHYAAAGGGQHG